MGSTLSLIGIGTALSLAYTVFNYTVQLTLVEIFGYHFRGLFEICMSILGLVSIIFSFNFYTEINLYVSRNSGIPKNLKKLSQSILLVQMVAVVLVYIISKKTEAMANESNLILLAAIILATLLNHKVNEFTAILNGHHYFIKAKLLALYGSIFTAVLIGILYIFHLRSEYLIICTALVGPFLGSFIYYKMLSAMDKKISNQFGNLDFRSLYIANRGVYIISLSQFISIKLYLLLLAQLASLEMVGIFSLAYSITQFIVLPATFLATIVLSNRTDNLAALTRSFKVVMGYSVLIGVGLNIGINLNLMDLVPLASMRNPTFVKILNFMTISIPFAVLNILVVAAAIRLNALSKLFIFTQFLLVPTIILWFLILRTFVPLEAALTGGYILAWAFVSIIGFANLKQYISKKAEL